MQKKELVIGIDIRALGTHHSYRGIGVYIKNLLLYLSEIDKSNKYYLFVDRRLTKLELNLNPEFNYQFVEVSSLPNSLRARIFAAYRPLAWNTDVWGIDIFLQPDLSNGMPRGRAKKIAVFYDLIPVLFKKFYNPRQQSFKQRVVQKLLWRAYIRTLKSYKKQAAVISISESSKKDLLKFDHNLSSKKVHTIYLGVEATSHKATSKNTALKLINKPYFLYVGSCDWRKNVTAIIEAFDDLRKSKDCSLVLIGKDIKDGRSIPLNQAIEASLFKTDIITAGFVNNNELGLLYAKASAFVFSSLYEGMGLPVIEAMAYGCPVITYNNSSIGEIAGDAALFVNSPSDMANSMRKILAMDKSSRNKIVAAGLKQAQKFNWRRTAQETLDLLAMV